MLTLKPSDSRTKLLNYLIFFGENIPHNHVPMFYVQEIKDIQAHQENTMRKVIDLFKMHKEECLFSSLPREVMSLIARSTMGVEFPWLAKFDPALLQKTIRNVVLQKSF